jgi:hypothetical protein
MNKTTAALVAIIVVLATSFAWYAARHPASAPQTSSENAYAPQQGSTLPAGPRTLTADIATAGLARLALKVGVGEVHVTPSADDKLHVQVTLRQKEREFMWFFHWASQGTAQDIAAATLKQQQQDKQLGLSLDYPSGQNEDDLKQEWDVQVPARLALDADMKVGELTIEGVAGGVDAKLNVGELSIDTPKGAIHADVNVGEIRAKSGTDRHGNIDLSSNIGETVVTIAGKNAGSREHGGLGNSVKLDGDGPDAMHLSINIGEASLRITPPEAATDKGHK